MSYKAELEKLEAEYAELKEQSEMIEEELESENAELTNQVEELQSTLRACTKGKAQHKEVDKLIVRIQKFTKSKKELTDKVRTLENENDALKSRERLKDAKLEDLETEVESSGENVICLKAQLSELQDELTRARSKANASAPSGTASTSSLNELGQLREENKALLERLEARDAESCDMVPKEDYDDLVARIEEQNEELEQLEDENAKLKEEAGSPPADTAADLAALQTKVASLEKHRDSLQTRISQLTSKNAELEAFSAGFGSEKLEMETEQRRLREEVAEINEQNDELKEVKAILGSAKLELETQLKAMKDGRMEEIAKLEKRIREKDEELAALHKASRESQAQMSDLERKTQEKAEADPLKLELAQAHLQQKRLEGELAETQKQLADQKVKNNGELEKFQRRLSQTETSKGVSEAAVEEVKNQLLSSESQRDQLTAEVVLLKARLKDRDRESQTVTELREAYASCLTRETTLKQENERLQGAYGAMENKMVEFGQLQDLMETEKERLTDQIRLLTEKHATAVSEGPGGERLRELESKCGKQEAELTANKETIGRMERDRKAMVDAVCDMRSERTALTGQVKALEAEKQALTKHIQSLGNERMSLTKDLERAKSEKTLVAASEPRGIAVDSHLVQQQEQPAMKTAQELLALAESATETKGTTQRQETQSENQETANEEDSSSPGESDCANKRAWDVERAVETPAISLGSKDIEQFSKKVAELEELRGQLQHEVAECKREANVRTEQVEGLLATNQSLRNQINILQASATAQEMESTDTPDGSLVLKEIELQDRLGAMEQEIDKKVKEAERRKDEETKAAALAFEATIRRLESRLLNLRAELAAWKEQGPKLKAAVQVLQNQTRALRNDSAKSVEFLRTGFNEMQAMMGNGKQLGVTDSAAVVQKRMEIMKRQLQLEVKQRRKISDQLQRIKGNVRVYCRVRPLLPAEVKKGAEYAVDFPAQDTVTVYSGGKSTARPHTFRFDRCFDAHKTQGDLFEDFDNSIMGILEGFDVCIFAYGMTGSGKTYTIEGPKDNPGVRERSLQKIFNYIDDHESDYDFSVKISLLEIYNNELRDLLVPADKKNPPKLKIFTRKSGNTEVQHLTHIQVTRLDQVLAVLDKGSLARAVGKTDANEHSSRSHMLAALTLKSKSKLTGTIMKGRLNLVDLAGSERLRHTSASGDRLNESVHINQSLTALGNVINALAKQKEHIPYRNSKLTQLLQSSLENARTFMVVNISPAAIYANETLQSLQFAKRVKEIELGQATSHQVSASFIKQQRELEDIRKNKRKIEEQLEEVKTQNSSLGKALVNGRENSNNSLQLAKKRIKALNEIVNVQNDAYKSQARAVARNIKLDKEIASWKRKCELLDKKFSSKAKEAETIAKKVDSLEADMSHFKTESRHALRDSKKGSQHMQKSHEEEMSRLTMSLEKERRSRKEEAAKFAQLTEKLKLQVAKLSKEKQETRNRLARPPSRGIVLGGTSSPGLSTKHANRTTLTIGSSTPNPDPEKPASKLSHNTSVRSSPTSTRRTTLRDATSRMARRLRCYPPSPRAKRTSPDPHEPKYNPNRRVGTLTAADGTRTPTTPARADTTATATATTTSLRKSRTGTSTPNDRVKTPISRPASTSSLDPRTASTRSAGKIARPSSSLHYRRGSTGTPQTAKPTKRRPLTAVSQRATSSRLSSARRRSTTVLSENTSPESLNGRIRSRSRGDDAFLRHIERTRARMKGIRK